MLTRRKLNHMWYPLLRSAGRRGCWEGAEEGPKHRADRQSCGHCEAELAPVLRHAPPIHPQGCKCYVFITLPLFRYLGFLLLRQGSSHVFIPAEKKIPKIRIETRQAEHLMSQRIVVVIDNWPKNSRYPKVRMLSYFLGCFVPIHEEP